MIDNGDSSLQNIQVSLLDKFLSEILARVKDTVLCQENPSHSVLQTDLINTSRNIAPHGFMIHTIVKMTKRHGSCVVKKDKVKHVRGTH